MWKMWIVKKSVTTHRHGFVTDNLWTPMADSDLGWALGTEKGSTLCGFGKEERLKNAHARFGGGNGPLTVDTWPAHQIIRMQALLFISSQPVSTVILLPTYFFKIIKSVYCHKILV